MKRTYESDKFKIILYLIILISVAGIISILYMVINQFNDQSKSTSFAILVASTITVFCIYVFPKSSSSLGLCQKLNIELDEERICYIKRKNIKSCKWKNIDEIEYNCFIFLPESRLAIWYEGREDEPIEIPVFMKNSKQLYKEIYENVKEKSPNAKIDRRFIKYVEEKC
ncbi:MAG: hypothetical protein U0M66_05765 [Bacilli bacterium]|jgi:uncharacterized protein involved in tolerance to divalent cations|nr:hypothetical protein [Bacilli bacterium]